MSWITLLPPPPQKKPMRCEIERKTTLHDASSVIYSSYDVDKHTIRM